MFQKQQIVRGLNKLEEDTHVTVEGTETVQCNYVKTKCGPKVYSKVFHSRYSTPCETSVHDVLILE